MRVGHWILLVALLLGVLAVPAFGADGGTGDSCAGSVPSVENVTTHGDPDVVGTRVEVSGDVRASDDGELTAWFEYRAVASGGDWRATSRTEVATNSCGHGWFEATLTDLEPHTTYEYRAVAATGNDTDRGPVRTFTTSATADESTPTVARTPTRTPRRLTRTPTPDPCPYLRGAGGLCTRTPTRTPTPHEDPRMTPDAETVDERERPPRRDPGIVAWFAGLLPLLAWVGAVTVVAPLVLGGLLGLDSLRRER